MEILLALAPVAPFLAGSVAVYNAVHQRFSSPVRGWYYNVDLSNIVTNGKLDAVVTIRPMGQTKYFEVNPWIWGEADKSGRAGEEIPKFSCTSKPIQVTVEYTANQPGGAPWVGVVHTRATKWRVAEHATRINVETKEYQRWKWHTVRNLFRLRREPSGHWTTAGHLKPRDNFAVPV